MFYCVLIILKWINLNIILSYEFAFFSILLIVFASYFNYKNFILAQAKNYQKDFIYPSLFYIKKIEKLPRIVKFIPVKDDLTLNFKDRLRFFTLFFALFKLIAYGVLVAGIFIFASSR
ncbi:Probable integral membrane protein Cj0851c [Campylobacter coli 76339]|nr:Probable integral membrane protein Cj0851c [Campylobacter coli 76339]